MTVWEELKARGLIAQVTDDDFDAPTEGMTTIMPLLYQSGYITIKDYDEIFRSYTLGIPNNEVRIGLTKALVPSYVMPNTLVVNNTARNIARCLAKDDIDGALSHLKNFLSTVPYCNDATHFHDGREKNNTVAHHNQPPLSHVLTLYSLSPLPCGLFAAYLANNTQLFRTSK